MLPSIAELYSPQNPGPKSNRRKYKEIIQVCFSWAVPTGLDIRFKTGHVEWFSFEELNKSFGEEKATKFHKIATKDEIFIGCWRNVT